jgi:hypothetical protein
VRSLHPIMVLILFVAACSSTPQRPAGPSLVDARTQAAPPINGSQAALASGQPVAAAGGQAPAGTAAGSAAAGTSANTASPPVLDAKLLQEGYRPATYHGQQLYCRKQSVTGTQFTTKVCLTPDQIRDQEEQAKRLLETVRPDTSCTQLKCN